MKLPGNEEKMGPSNTPKHLSKSEHKDVKFDKRSNVGASLVYVTLDSEEDARRFVKRLFSKSLIANAEFHIGGFERSYLMFGHIETAENKVWLELTTSDDRVKELVNYINANDPTTYDYPVTDVQVEPIQQANKQYIEWVKMQTAPKKAFKYDQDLDKE
uniref:Uncharacterized protein n=1 Tax=Strombidium rassoulzadegani TaxID=1082188 RepID=A0A7S3FVP8_9SPIT|mmetsp:Transcript_16505/g.28031  ORF Transcript_16505/g.28031 Transcript_16505/m.28031 type:complete len:159 (+) Transcript_16505:253-729(+)|eukprot:CAMPEP_0168609278 /NCGR_PEP_ID=MMETSP0449_2-20121227/1112_1 /TAXON_ID=1082188 /ORGANISM="Strombidium rassoulzadegani, Strain ras09" /LENGTH=158 /DNA_ID=CAMNT_0008649393 /DNA_START=143 /DNA_END=619 /DNA_ORIENTATION=+